MDFEDAKSTGWLQHSPVPGISEFEAETSIPLMPTGNDGGRMTDNPNLITIDNSARSRGTEHQQGLAASEPQLLQGAHGGFCGRGQGGRIAPGNPRRLRGPGGGEGITPDSGGAEDQLSESDLTRLVCSMPLLEPDPVVDYGFRGCDRDQALPR
jgi:hypothetical protein